MSARLSISSEQTGNTIHIRLKGFFDDTLAEELLSKISHYSSNAGKIVVHTDGIKTFHPFGQRLFIHKYPVLKKESVKMVITGKNRDKMMLKKNEPSWVKI